MTTEAETCSLFRITDKLIQGIEHELIKHGWGVRYTWDECGLTFFLDRTNETDEALEFERVIVRLPLGDCGYLPIGQAHLFTNLLRNFQHQLRRETARPGVFARPHRLQQTPESPLQEQPEVQRLPGTEPGNPARRLPRTRRPPETRLDANRH